MLIGGLVVWLYTTAVTGFGAYLWAIGPSGGPRAAWILYALVVFWLFSVFPREWWGHRYAGALVRGTAVAGTTVLTAVLLFNPVS